MAVQTAFQGRYWDLFQRCGNGSAERSRRSEQRSLYRWKDAPQRVSLIHYVFRLSDYRFPIHKPWELSEYPNQISSGLKLRCHCSNFSAPH